MAYKISVEASRDIENIWLYTLEMGSVAQGDRYINLIFDEIEYLANNPLTGRDVSFIRQNYRSSKVKSHVIFYRVMEPKKDIEIIRVLHQQMDIPNRLND